MLSRLITLILMSAFKMSFAAALPTLDENEINKCSFLSEELWEVHAWFLAESATLTLKILTSSPFQDNGDLQDYQDTLLELVHAGNIEQTVRIDVYNISKNNTTPRTRSIPAFTPHLRKRLNSAHSFSSEHQEAYIIIVWNDSILKLYLHSFPSSIILNTRARYMILFLEHYTCNNTTRYNNILPVIWHRFKVLNLITLSPCSCNPHIIYKYDPFFFDNATSQWGLIKQRTINKARKNSFRFINTPKSLKGITLNVSMFERIPTAVRKLPQTMQHYDCMHVNLAPRFGGLDGCVLRNLAYYLNFNVRIVEAMEYGYRATNGSYVGSLAHVVYGAADFAGNSRYMFAVDIENIEYTIPVSNDVACFIVPKPKRMPQWAMLFKCFKVQTWWAIMGVVVLLGICLNVGWKINIPNQMKLSKHEQFRRKHCTYFIFDILDIFGIWLSVSVTIPTTITHQRVILATSMIFNVIVAGIFQGFLFDSFSRILYYPPINTFKELYDSGLPISTSVDVFQDSSSEVLKLLKTRRINLDEKAIKRTAYKRDVISVERIRDANFLMQTDLVSADGIPLLHIVPECPSRYFLAYAVQKNSPYLPRLNDLLQRFLESGLIDKWQSDTIDGFIMQKKIHTKYKSDDRKPFTFEDVQTSFYILVIGLIIGVVVFILEVVYFCLCCTFKTLQKERKINVTKVEMKEKRNSFYEKN